MVEIKCKNCGCMIEANEEITSGLKLPVLTSICKCGRFNMEYKDKFVFIPINERKCIHPMIYAQCDYGDGGHKWFCKKCGEYY